ncbi:long-chain fatty acid--CoA ligase [Sphingomonas ginsenosidivorax]|uniref:Long-chain fatty acid--CoA ligase n=1 Tax=Sphingomonas ginsenosidivorax TaxID=862135 RepID=A0A5C6UE36_9SPHN|nr:fatty acid--CoA ligase family protein [Sphingomonas ginsenosidivorax]TXC70295.1 long-chain fatty acid--CoA ligase [Sphingomonas ginsenosidivorax]
MQTLAELCAQTLAIDPARPAIEYDGVSHSWGSVQALAGRIASLLAESGIGSEAAVAFMPRNRPSALAALLGLLIDARSVAMIYAFQSPEAIAAALDRTEAPVVVLAVEDATPEVRRVLAAKRIAAIVLDGMTARLLAGFAHGRERADDGPPRIDILTSGTTGPPKQFALPHAVIARFVLNQGMSLIDDPAEPPFLMAFPIPNITGIYSTAASLLRGKRVVLLDRFSVAAWQAFVKRYRPRASGAPPAAVKMILDADIPVEDLASLTSFGTGAAPLDPVIQRRFEDRYGIPILLSYGATEFGGPVAAMTTQLRAEFGDAKLGSVGRAMPGVELRVRDPDTGMLVPPGREGLLEVVSPRIGPDWIVTADIAAIDADGFLYLRGRADGAIMRGGFKVLPETIEAALLLHPAVAAAGVVRVPDPRVTQVPGAAIELRPGTVAPDVAALDAHVRRHLPATHVPAHWRFVATLPRNPSFKVDRPAIERLFA